MPRNAPPVVYRTDTGLMRHKKYKTPEQKEARELMTIERNRKSAAESRIRQKQRDRETRDHIARQMRLVARLSDALAQNANEFIRYRSLENDWERQQFIDNTANIRDLLSEARYNSSSANFSPYTPAKGNMAPSTPTRSSSNLSMQTGAGGSIFPHGNIEQDSFDHLAADIGAIHLNASEAKMAPQGILPANEPDSSFNPVQQAFPPLLSEPSFDYGQDAHQAFQDDMQTTNTGPDTSSPGPTLYNGLETRPTDFGYEQITYQPYQSTTHTMSTTTSTATHFGSTAYTSPNYVAANNNYSSAMRRGMGYSVMLSDEKYGVDDSIAQPTGETQLNHHPQSY